MAGSCGSRPSGLTPTGRSTQLVLTTLPTCIGPIATCLAQSEPKKRFFERLGLDEGNKLHRRLYLNMKAEVVEGWKRMTANRDSLVLQLRDDPTVEPPYGFNYIDDQIMHDEIARIYHDARPDTRLMFNLGRTSRVDPGENWIIRWLLWHIFRYRDGRNVMSYRRRRMRLNGELDYHSEASPESQPTEPDMHLDDQTEEREHSSAEPALSRTQSNPENTQAIRASRYFDPVRDLYRTCPT